MFRRKRTNKMYHAPRAVVQQMVLEGNFCQSVLFNVQVDEIHHMNTLVDPDVVDTAQDPFYFEF